MPTFLGLFLYGLRFLFLTGLVGVGLFLFLVWPICFVSG